MLKHDVKGTKEATFEDQGECDPIVEDMEVLLDSLREDHLAAEVKGNMVGNLVLVDSGDEIDCGGWARADTASPRSSSRR